MGAEFSKRKCRCHKNKPVDKETWTNEGKADEKLEANVELADKANQCVLQWIQNITANG